MRTEVVVESGSGGKYNCGGVGDGGDLGESG